MLRNLLTLFRRWTNPVGWHHHLGDPTTMRRVGDDGSYEYRPMTAEETAEAIQWQAHR